MRLLVILAVCGCVRPLPQESPALAAPLADTSSTSGSSPAKPKTVEPASSGDKVEDGDTSRDKRQWFFGVPFPGGPFPGRPFPGGPFPGGPFPAGPPGGPHPVSHPRPNANFSPSFRTRNNNPNPQSGPGFGHGPWHRFHGGSGVALEELMRYNQNMEAAWQHYQWQRDQWMRHHQQRLPDVIDAAVSPMVPPGSPSGPDVVDTSPQLRTRHPGGPMPPFQHPGRPWGPGWQGPNPI